MTVAFVHRNGTPLVGDVTTVALALLAIELSSAVFGNEASDEVTDDDGSED